jgi:hypothetical protein
MLKPRIALIHATPLAIQPINSAFTDLWPEVVLMNLLDDSLSQDHAKNSGVLTEEMTQRFIDLAQYAKTTGADAILFTCSAFGPAIDVVKDEVGIPTLKPNEAMFEKAFELMQHSQQEIALIATFEPSLAPMCDEFKALAESHSSKLKLTPYFVDNAMNALGRGDAQTHHDLIAYRTENLNNPGLILLAQFSMAAAQPLVAQRTKAPVLTSPECAVLALRSLILG